MKHKHIYFSEYTASVTVAENCPQEVIDALKELCRLAYYNLKDESKQPQPPDFANTMLGEVPHEVNDQQEEISKVVEGATPVVRQNEQTRLICRCTEPKEENGICKSCQGERLY